jgi:cation-dependent mannose-6-phosphate receptor
MQLLYYSLSLYLSLTAADPFPAPAPAPAKSTDAPRVPCTIRSPTSGAFFDLNPLHILPPAEAKSKHPREVSWNTTGYDYGYNFTLNFCGPVIETLEKVEGVGKEELRNVSAFYKDESGKVFSLGSENHEPVLRGRKLVLNYTGGSPCGGDSKSRRSVDLLGEREIIDDDDDDKKKKGKGDKDDDKKDDDKKKHDDDDDKGDTPSKSKTPSGERRKSTIISMLCDRDPLSPLLTLNFVGADTDECTYFFEARSSAACGGIEVAKQTLSPGGVFGVIAIITFAVYIVGGCVYSRMVLQQRGWRQLPNYALWAGIGGFLKVPFSRRSFKSL